MEITGMRPSVSPQRKTTAAVLFALAGISGHAIGCPGFTMRLAMEAGFADEVESGDINGDGIDDLVIVTRAPSAIIVRYGDDDGQFHQSAVLVEGWFYGLALGDVDADGDDDVVVGRGGGVGVLINHGGMLAPLVSYTSPFYSHVVNLIDFNGDGLIDIVSNNEQFESVGVMLNQGGGLFGTEESFGVGVWPRGIDTGDINGDGFPDIVTSNAVSDDISVLLGIGDGSFEPELRFPVGADPYGPVITDMNGDGQSDLVVGSQRDETISVYLNTGGPELFADRADFDAGGPVYSLAAGDVDGDGDPDLAAAMTALFHSNVPFGSVLLNDGAGNFELEFEFGTSDGAVDVELIDYGRDGDLDVFFVNRPAGLGRFIENRCEPSEPCSVSDVAFPYGTLDLTDIGDYVGAFLAGDSIADLAAPIGVFDSADLQAFVIGFLAGCP